MEEIKKEAEQQAAAETDALEKKKKKKNKKKAPKEEDKPTPPEAIQVSQAALEEEKTAEDHLDASPKEVPLRKQQRLAQLHQEQLKQHLQDSFAAPEVAGAKEESCPAACAAYSSSDEGRVPETLEKGEEAKEEGQSSGNEGAYF
uniref:Uncharacterized protein n=1 Tax=Strombidium inclinatum TaxID=197538 RepID=A0A7S3IX55_9SPIT|mmetsp:Transcript_7229/g.11366  ORF Transcript_7229/g.11366 Transcript_7229/m.11366 type:complete len:145 (+) Transcript_7229:1221-1655(+)